MKSKTKRAAEKPEADIVRASISFPIDDYAKLEQAAEKKHVSLAWVVREAVREYLAGKTSSSDRE